MLAGTLALRHTPGVTDLPFRFVPGARRDVVVLCDHASNHVPAEYADLGLPPDELDRHIAWDPGAHGAAVALASALDCPLVHGIHSRLLVDLNRAHDDATLILAESDNTFVPGNLTISDDERAARVARFHAPYHARIDAHLDGLHAHGVRPTVVAVHSFNPVLGGVARPWEIGVLWKLDRAPVAPLIDWLAGDGWHVGDNQPYDGRTAMGWTLEYHAVRRGLPHVMFELRNDVVADGDAQATWGRRLARALRETGFVA
ncbi:MAG: N-formylglutamate amidohydrolase [Xanthomonadaceae bacterium]|jgi:predicted N-formylglutamate amidohydrolase|nr:N-formylglutamate amidohydrolase [Xanthomonadaceae bacterium]